jgi:hypothetical chaperone protein
MARMEAASPPTIYALDFGTSNSLLAAANAERTFAPVPLDPGAPTPIILRSVLWFPDGRRCHYGEEALRRYAASGLEGRLLRSIKRHLASRSFNGTFIDERPMAVEDIVAAMLREMRVRADTFFATEVDKVVLGRPARFSEDPRDDALAERRLVEAAHRAGFREVTLLPEPVAAARDLGVGVGEERVVFVADYGGGTSDFTVMRVGPRPFREDDVLAVGGVPVAGDALDAAIMRSHVARHFGAEVVYRVPFGSNVLTMPKPIMENLCSPAHLSILRRQDVAEFLRNVRGWSVGPDDRHRLDQLRVLVEDGLGFSVFEAIEQCKRALSGALSAEVAFSYPSIEVREHVTRPGFEAAAEKATGTILRCLDDTLAAAAIGPDDIDLVCCTGGTAKVPRLASEIRRRFGEGRVRDHKSFTSVVEGLAVHAKAWARGEGARIGASA